MYTHIQKPWLSDKYGDMFAKQKHLRTNMRYRYTQLFVNGLPVDYNMIVKDEEFIFEPGYNPHEDLMPPLFRVKKNNGKFHYEDLEDESLKYQAEEEIIEYLKQDRLN